LNKESAPVAYYDLHMAKQIIEVPIIFVALIPFILGFLLAMSFTFVSQVKSKAAIAKRNRTIKSLNEDLDRLKSHTKISEPTVGVDNI
jgi:uncharacterized integral membrane protein